MVLNEILKISKFKLRKEVAKRETKTRARLKGRIQILKIHLNQKAP
jgi:hypothetical protein